MRSKFGLQFIDKFNYFMRFLISRYSILTCAASLSFLAGCNDGTSQKLVEEQQITARLTSENANLASEKERLEQRVLELESENSELSNTPERRLSEISVLIEKRDETAAASAIAMLKNKFPQAPEVGASEKLLLALKRQILAERENTERKERLGFKILREVTKFEVPGLKILVSSPQSSGRWTFDSYNDTYHYRDAERGTRYVVARISITADKGEKDPNLPGFGVYEFSGNKLKLLKRLSYEFVRWNDFASYLGNDTDFRNDFAHTATIPFTVGTQVDEESLQKPAFLIAARANCHSRDYERFKNPPVSYIGICSEIKQELSLDEASSDNYAVLKIWNGSKL